MGIKSEGAGNRSKPHLDCEGARPPDCSRAIGFWMDKRPISPNRLIGRHWAAKHRERDEWMVWLRASLTPEQIVALREASGAAHPANHFGAQQMRAEIHVVQPMHLFDEDNLEASLKPL